MLAASLLANAVGNNQAPSSYAFPCYCICITSSTTHAFARFEIFEEIEEIALVVLEKLNIFLFHKQVEKPKQFDKVKGLITQNDR